MARGINKVIIVGNLGADPDIRYMANGNPVANLSVATSESWKDKQSGERQERTEWHRIVLFNRLAEIASEYIKKGNKVYLEGSLRTRKWQDQNGAGHRSALLLNWPGWSGMVSPWLLQKENHNIEACQADVLWLGKRNAG